MLQIIDKLKMDRVRDTTKNNYYCVWRTFNEFYIKLDNKPDNWEDRMVLFAGYLANCNKKSTTIKSYMSAIKSVLKDDGVHVSEDRFLLAAITKACSFKNDRISTRLPIQKGVLKLLLESLQKLYDQQPYLLAMYQALFSTAYFGMFRVGELTRGNHPVRAKDVHIAMNKNKLMFVLHTSKTHWKNNNPQIIKISSKDIASKHKAAKDFDAICPYTLLRNYLRIRSEDFRSVQEQFFVFRDRSEVTAENFREVLKSAIKKAGLNYKLYNCSSFRSGRAVDLLRKKISVETIRKLGRWKSSAIYRYFR